MAPFDRRIDDFIEKAQDFAKPILNYLRTAVHKACPHVQETIKWGMPYFQYEGKNLCGMASFKEHCAFVFPLGAVMTDPAGLMQTSGEKTGMGHFGKIRSLNDLPAEKILMQYIREAMSLTETGARIPKKKSAQKKLVVPEDFMKLLKKNMKALATFENFSYSHKKEYVEWIAEAKRAETRSRRMATALEFLEAGRDLSWKYKK